MRFAARALCVLMILGAAVSSAAAQPAGEGGPGGGGRGGQRIRERFEAANTTHDGRLTIQQAETAHLQNVVRVFPEIDIQQKGYITEDDVRIYLQQHRRGGGMGGGRGPGAMGGAGSDLN